MKEMSFLFFLRGFNNLVAKLLKHNLAYDDNEPTELA